MKPDPIGLWPRIKLALDLESAPEIARKLSLTKQSVYDWQKGKMPSLENLLVISKSGHASLHWLITGEGPVRASGGMPPEKRDVKAKGTHASKHDNEETSPLERATSNLEKALREYVRELVREEMEKLN